LASIRKDIEIDFDLRDAAIKEPDKEILSRLFSEFEFSSLLQEINAILKKLPKNINRSLDRKHWMSLVCPSAKEQ